MFRWRQWQSVLWPLVCFQCEGAATQSSTLVYKTICPTRGDKDGLKEYMPAQPTSWETALPAVCSAALSRLRMPQKAAKERRSGELERGNSLMSEARHTSPAQKASIQGCCSACARTRIYRSAACHHRYSQSVKIVMLILTEELDLI